MVFDEPSSVKILPRRSSPEGNSIISKASSRFRLLARGSHRLVPPQNRPEQAEISGEADSVEVVSFPHSFASGRADSLIVADERIRYAIRQAFFVEKVHQLTVFSGADYLLDRRCAGADEKTSRRHSLQQRPGEHERVGEIYVHRGDLQYRQILLIGQPSEKMDAAQIECALQLSKQLRPVAFCPRWPAPVADAVAADNQHVRRRQPLKHPR